MEEIQNRLLSLLVNKANGVDNQGSSLYGEIFAVSYELGKVKELLAEIQRELFIATATDYGISKREKLWGPQRTDLTVEERRNLINLRYRFNSDCLSDSLAWHLKELLGVEFTVSRGVEPYKLTVSASEELSEIKKANFIRHIKNMFPIISSISFSFN